MNYFLNRFRNDENGVFGKIADEVNRRLAGIELVQGKDFRPDKSDC